MSDVATTTIDFFKPASPKSCSMNSFNSLPRSPTSAKTLISASEFLANIPKSVDFPTPLPAKIPIRCPKPIGVNVSIALTEVSKALSITGRLKASGIFEWKCSTQLHFNGPLLSNGVPKGPITRPNRTSPMGTAFL